MKPYLHAKSSAVKFGGVADDYLPIHDFIDSSKAHLADPRHRALLHSTFGCFVVEKVFGAVATNSAGGSFSPRDVAEQHCLEDLGHIPTVPDWFADLPVKEWMGGGKKEDIPSANALARYTAAKKSASETLKEAAKGLPAELAKVFESSPFAAVQWVQYMPGFNDGEPCRFSRGDVYTLTTLPSADERDDDWDDENAGEWDYSTYEWKEDTPEITAEKAARKVVQDAVYGVDDDLMEEAFENNKRILWVRGEGVKVEDYDCGY